jgi:hypothetical protein
MNYGFLGNGNRSGQKWTSNLALNAFFHRTLGLLAIQSQSL